MSALRPAPAVRRVVREKYDISDLSIGQGNPPDCPIPMLVSAATITAGERVTKEVEDIFLDCSHQSSENGQRASFNWRVMTLSGGRGLFSLDRESVRILVPTEMLEYSPCFLVRFLFCLIVTENIQLPKEPSLLELASQDCQVLCSRDLGIALAHRLEIVELGIPEQMLLVESDTTEPPFFAGYS